MVQLTKNNTLKEEKRLSVSQALKLIEKKFHSVASKEYITIDSVNNRYLAKDIISKINIPPANNTAVDGVAFKYSDLKKSSQNFLKLDGRIIAGSRKIVLGKNKAVKIFTGAIMPRGADTVVMLEDVKIDKNENVYFPIGIKKGMNVRHKGEDVKIKKKILNKGQFLRPQDIAMLAATGNKRVLVYKKINIAVFSNGDELTEPKNKLSKGKIYDANRYMIISFLKKMEMNILDLGIITDSKEKIEKLIKKASIKCDLIISSGGMSQGEEDYIHRIIRENGNLYIWQLAVKPGRPFGIGKIYSKPFIGLPGNPAAAFVTFLLIAMPVISLLASGLVYKLKSYSVTSSFTHKKKKGRQEYLRGIIYKKNNKIYTKKYFKEGAGLISSLVWSEGLIEIPSKISSIKPGDKVSFLPLNEFFY